MTNQDRTKLAEAVGAQIESLLTSEQRILSIHEQWEYAQSLKRLLAVAEAAQMFLNTETGDGFRAKEQWELEEALAALDQTEQTHD